VIDALDGGGEGIEIVTNGNIVEITCLHFHGSNKLYRDYLSREGDAPYLSHSMHLVTPHESGSSEEEDRSCEWRDVLCVD
jgi:hypothetical protein